MVIECTLDPGMRDVIHKARWLTDATIRFPFPVNAVYNCEIVFVGIHSYINFDEIHYEIPLSVKIINK